MLLERAMITIAGIIIAKHNSNRFPGKNFFIYKNKPIFLYNANLLINNKNIDDVFVSTNSFEIKKICEIEKIKIVERKINISYDDQSYFDVVRYTYFCLEKKYDWIITILANSINHKKEDIENVIATIKNDECNEVRSFNSDGIESGILAFSKNVILNQKEISSKIIYIKNNAREIHYASEL
jgi:CMP-N-acetylneuraminic acid synthetase